jgi:TP901 family phage tail tape measure protein
MAGRFSVEGIFRAHDRMSRPLDRMTAGADRMSKRFSASASKMNDAADRMLGRIARVGTGLTALGAGATGVAVGVGAIGMNFETAMSSVAAVSGATEAQLDALKNKALELGATSKFSGTEVVGAMEAMTKSGYGVQDVLTGVDGLLAAAAADGGDLQTIAASVMSSMKGLGLGPERMKLFADQLAKAGDSTAASIGSLTEGLAIFGPVARQLNVPIESAIAQLALLEDAGLASSVAATGLSAAYSKLAAPVGTTKKALKELGIEVADSFGNMKPPDQLMAEIMKATGKIEGNVGQMAAMTELVGLESQKAFLNLAAAAGDGKLSALTDELSKATGYADKIAAVRMDNLGGDLKIARGAAEGLATKLYNLESGPLRGVVQGMTEWMRANEGVIVSGLSQYIALAIPLIDNFTDGVMDGFSSMTPYIEAAIAPLAWMFGSDAGPRTQAYLWGDTVGTLAVAFGVYYVATKAAAAATWGFGVVTRGVAVLAWAWSAAITATRAAMTFYQIATKAGVGATIAMSFASKLATADTVINTVATGARTTAQWLLSGATKAAALVTGLFSTATVASTAATVTGTAATTAATTSMGAFAAAAGAALAAVGALYLAWDQWQSLSKETGGGWDFWNYDEKMNAQARARAKATTAPKVAGMPAVNAPSLGNDYGLPPGFNPAAPYTGASNGLPAGFSPADALAGLDKIELSGAPQVVMPDGRAPVDDKMEITVRAEGGTAEVTKKPARKGTTVKLEDSGAF